LLVEGPGVKQPRLSVGGSSQVPLNVDETDLSKLAASIVAPSGKEEPCELKRLDSGQTGSAPMPLSVVTIFRSDYVQPLRGFGGAYQWDGTGSLLGGFNFYEVSKCS